MKGQVKNHGPEQQNVPGLSPLTKKDRNSL